mgnify:FL=1
MIDTITEDIEYWLPYISITDVDIISSTDMHSITIRLHFSVSTIGANLVINILATENEISIIDTTVDAQSPEEILVEVDSFDTNSGGGMGSQY